MLPCTLLNQTTGIVSGSSFPNENTGTYVYRARADTEESGLGLFPGLFL